MKTYLTLIIFLVTFSAFAQSHTYKPGCRYYVETTSTNAKDVHASRLAEDMCPACLKDARAEEVARVAETDRINRLVADKKAAEQKAVKAAAAKAIADKQAKIKADAAAVRMAKINSLNAGKINAATSTVKGAGFLTYEGHAAITDAELKGVVTFVDEGTKTVGIRTKGKIIASFDRAKYYYIDSIKNSPYFLLYGTNTQYILDKRGNPVKIAGEAAFNRITVKGDQIIAEALKSDYQVVGNGDMNFNSEQMYNTADEVKQHVADAIENKKKEFAEEMAKKTAAEREELSHEVYIVSYHDYAFARYKKIYMDARLHVLNVKDGYFMRPTN